MGFKFDIHLDQESALHTLSIHVHPHLQVICFGRPPFQPLKFEQPEMIEQPHQIS